MTCPINAVLVLLAHLQLLRDDLPAVVSEPLARCLENPSDATNVHNLLRTILPREYNKIVSSGGSPVEVLLHLAALDRHTATALSSALPGKPGKRFLPLARYEPLLVEEYSTFHNRFFDAPVGVEAANDPWIWVALAGGGFTPEHDPSVIVVGAIEVQSFHCRYFYRSVEETGWFVQDDMHPPRESDREPKWLVVDIVLLIRRPRLRGGADPPLADANRSRPDTGTEAEPLSAIGRKSRAAAEAAPPAAAATTHFLRAATVNMQAGYSSRTGKDAVVTELARRHAAAIICVSEWGVPPIEDLRELEQLGFAVVECVRFERTIAHLACEKRGGAALLIRSAHFEVQKLEFGSKHTNCQVALARCKAKGVKDAVWFTAAAAYIPPTATSREEPPIDEILSDAAATAEAAGAPLILLGGDFNARDESWDAGTDTNDRKNWSRGKTLAATFKSLGLHVTAGPTYERVDRATGATSSTSFIDLLATTTPITTPTTVVRFPRLDHHALVADIGDERPARMRQHWVKVWVWRGVDLMADDTQRRFLDVLAANIGVGGVGALATGTRSIIIDKALHSALASILRERWVNASKLCVPRTGTEMLESAAKRAAGRGPHAFAREVNSGETGGPPTTLRQASNPGLALVGPQQATAVAQFFAATHRPRNSGTPPSAPTRAPQLHLQPEIVRMALTHQRQSAGRDEHGLSPAVLTMAAKCDRFVNALTRLLEDIVQTGEAPDLWKRLLAIPLSKKDKNRVFLESYRAIFITHWLSRVGETVFEWFDRAAIARVPQSLAGLSIPHGLHVAQMGFRAGLGDHIVTLAGVDLWHEAHDNDALLLQVAIDLKDAFPSVQHDLALEELSHAGATPEGIAFRRALSKNNALVARIGLFKSAPIAADGGIKAGRKGGPMEWSAFSRPLLCALQRGLDSARVQPDVIGYGVVDGVVAASADDLSVFAIVNSPEAVNVTLAKIATQLESWQREYGLDLSPKSCCAVHHVERFASFTAQKRWTKTRSRDSVQAVIKPWVISGLTITPSVVASDPNIKNLGVTWSAQPDVFTCHVDALLASHARGMQLILPMVHSTPLPVLLQAYNAYALGTWTHSMPLIAGTLSAHDMGRLDQCHARALKRLSYMPSSAHSLAAIYECGSRPFVSLAQERLAALREQLVRVQDTANTAQQPLVLVRRALSCIERAYAKFAMIAPKPPSRAPMVWDAPLVDPKHCHLASRVTFLLHHDLPESDRELLTVAPESSQAIAVKAAANSRRRSVVSTTFPQRVEVYHDGSVISSAEDVNSAGAAVILYLDASNDTPNQCQLLAAPGNTCSFWSESLGSNAALQMVHDAIDVIPKRSTVVVWTDSLSRLVQLAAGPMRATTAETALGWQHLLHILSSGTVDGIVMAHHYSHVDDNPRTILVDEMAKTAAITLAASEDARHAPHWWKDDARTTLDECHSRNVAGDLKDATVRSNGPRGPTEWKDHMKSLGVHACRRLSQLRVGACTALGGYLHGIEHSATCGLCGTRVGRGNGLENATVHLFSCAQLGGLRVARGLDKIEDLWCREPLVVLRFVQDACARSRQGCFAKGPASLGADWPDNLVTAEAAPCSSTPSPLQFF